MTIGERVRVLRKVSNMTQEEFGNALSLSAASISQIESGLVRLTERTARSICKEFGVSHEWLLTGEGEMVSPEKESQEFLVLEFAEVLAKYPAVYETAKIASRHMTADDWKRINDLLEEIGG